MMFKERGQGLGRSMCQELQAPLLVGPPDPGPFGAAPRSVVHISIDPPT